MTEFDFSPRPGAVANPNRFRRARSLVELEAAARKNPTGPEATAIEAASK